MNNLKRLIWCALLFGIQALYFPLNRFLKGEQPVIEMAAKKFFTPGQLRVFDKLPVDAVNTNVQSLFVPKANPLSAEELNAKRNALLTTLKEKCFGGWPDAVTPRAAQRVFSV